jgi:DNA-directed RNA polymerase specialized sigma24 family protein
MNDHQATGLDPECQLLEAWRKGDVSARDQLLALLIPWLQSEIRRGLGAQTFSAMDSGDLTNNAIVNFLTWGPEFVPANGAQLRAALRRIAINEVIDQRRRRSHDGRHYESLLGTAGTCSAYGEQIRSGDRPSLVAQRNDEASWVRFALQFLEPDDRYLLVASEIEGHDWATIAKELSMSSPDAARVRATRLKPRFANILRKVKGGVAPDA